MSCRGIVCHCFQKYSATREIILIYPQRTVESGEQAVGLYEAVKTLTPDWDAASATVNAFDRDSWSETLRVFLSAAAEVMIAQEKTDGKYAFSRLAWDLGITEYLCNLL